MFSQNLVSRFTPVWEGYKIPIILGGVSFFLIVFSLLFLVKSTQTTKPIEFSNQDVLSAEESASASDLASIFVDVEGAVTKPGVYELPIDARVEDALERAGGITRDADEAYLAKNLNRAQKLADGTKIYIPTREEMENATSHNLDLYRRVNDTSYNPGSLLQRPDGQSQNEPDLLSGSSKNELLISINSASQSELESLTGVGPVTAKKIMDNRPYTSVEELLVKKAVGQKLFEKIKNFLTL